MKDNVQPITKHSFSPEDMVNASELREFVYCERAWFLSRQGFEVSAAAQSQRNEGVAFHEARAAASVRARSPWPMRWAVILAAAGIALLLLAVWTAGR